MLLFVVESGEGHAVGVDEEELRLVINAIFRLALSQTVFDL